jgi:hypothetical protein
MKSQKQFKGMQESKEKSKTESKIQTEHKNTQ